jgi:hypothetical protein
LLCDGSGPFRERTSICNEQACSVIGLELDREHSPRPGLQDSRDERGPIPQSQLDAGSIARVTRCGGWNERYWQRSEKMAVSFV